MDCIDLNDPKAFTMENVSWLIASADDSVHRQLRVSEAGQAFITHELGNVNTVGMRFWYEIWCAGNGYTGLEASRDLWWVDLVRSRLREDWTRGRRGQLIDGEVPYLSVRYTRRAIQRQAQLRS